MIRSFFKISERFIFQQNKLILENTLFKLKDIISENEMSFVEDVCGKKKKYVSKKKLADIEAKKDDVKVFEKEEVVEREEDPIVKEVVEREEDPLIVEEEHPVVEREEDPLIVEEEHPVVEKEEEEHPVVEKEHPVVEKEHPVVVKEEEDPLIVVKEEDPLIVEKEEEDLIVQKEEEDPLIVVKEEDPLIVEEDPVGEDPPIEPILKKNINSEFIMRELKYNLLDNSSLSNRKLIVKEILKEFKKSKSFELAKSTVYLKRNIVIVNQVSIDPNRSDENNKMIERDYDELRGCIVYGWDDDGEPLYEETYGCLIVSPTFKEAGHTWREVLQERWEQRSYCSEDENIDEYDGKYN